MREFDRRGLPKPPLNYPVRIGGQRRVLDLAWPDLGVYAELDSRSFHMAVHTFEADRGRHNLLAGDEWLPFRLTVRALEPDADAALAPLVRTLTRRSRRSGSRAS